MKEFFVGSMIGLLLAFLISTFGKAETISLSSTTITLQDTSHATAIAEVVFDNKNVNQPRHEDRYTLSLRDLTIEVEFVFDGSGPDSIIVYPPEGIMCFPYDCTLTVIEEQRDILLLFKLEEMS